jgi:hypothetical protein
MNARHDQLDAWCAAAREDLAQQLPPAWIESRLAARQAEHALLRRLRPAPATPARRATRWRLPRWALPVAAAALVLIGVGVVLVPADPPTATPSGAPSFMALAPLETIATEPRPMVITSDVPRAQLAAFGLPVDPARADLPVRAEFLVSRRGAVLAVRFSPE